MKENNYSNKNEQIFLPSRNSRQYGNTYLSPVVREIYSNVRTMGKSFEQFYSERHHAFTKEGGVAIIDQGEYGSGVRAKEPILPKTIIASGAEIKFGSPNHESSFDYASECVLVRSSEIKLSILFLEQSGKERENLLDIISVGLHQENIMYSRPCLLAMKGEELCLFYLNGRGELEMKPFPFGDQDNSLEDKDRECFIKLIETRAQIKPSKETLGKLNRVLNSFLEEVYLYTAPHDDLPIDIDRVQYAPLMTCFAGMPFMTKSLSIANAYLVPTVIGFQGQRVPIARLDALEYIPCGESIGREYGYGYLKEQYKNGKKFVFWNSSAEITPLCLYFVTRGMIENIKLILNKEFINDEDHICIFSFLKTVHPDFLYHLNLEEITRVKDLISLYSENHEQFTKETEYFLNNRYPAFLTALEGLEGSHKIFSPFPQNQELIYKEFFIGNHSEEIFNHRQSAFHALKNGLFLEIDSSSFNTDKYYQFPIDFYPETYKSLSSETSTKSLSVAAFECFQKEKYEDAIKLWLEVLKNLKDRAFYQHSSNLEAWQVLCKKELLPSSGGPLSVMASSEILTVLHNLGSAYQKLKDYENSFYFFSLYVNIITYKQAQKLPFNPAQFEKVKEKLASCYREFSVPLEQSDKKEYVEIPRIHCPGDF